MTPEKQRIAIAEACGFRKIHEVFYDWERRTKWNSPRRYFRSPNSDYGNKLFPNQAWGWGPPSEWNLGVPNWDGVPDYLNDLNAMHEAEETLTRKQLVDYCNFQLRTSTGEGCVTEYKMIRASAVQRAEAILRTVNKWNDKL